MVLNTLLMQTSLGLACLDRDLRYVLISQELAKLSGISAADHIGKHIGDVIPGLSPSIEKVIEKILRTKKPVKRFSFSGDHLRRSKTGRYFEANWHPMYGQGDSIDGFLVTVEQVSKYRKLEKALIRKTKQYREIVQNVNNIIMRSKKNGMISFINDYGAALFGYSSKELIRKSRCLSILS